MIEPMLRHFSDSRLRWLIVISLTLLLGCVILLPLVDVYFDKCREKELKSLELAEAKHVAANLAELEQRVAKRLIALAEIEGRTVTAEGTQAFRKRFESLARDTGCTMRRLQVGDPITRPWTVGDLPLSLTVDNEQLKHKTPFVLERRPVVLTLHGSILNLRNMLEQLSRDNMIVHAKNLELYPEGRARKNVMLELELWYFALERGA